MQTPDAQELARRFNEDEAVWRAFERRRTTRKILGPQDLLSAEDRDALDWQEAEREARPVRAIGILVP